MSKSLAHVLAAVFANPWLIEAERARAYYRKKRGYSPGYISGKGRPAITRLPVPSHLSKAA